MEDSAEKEIRLTNTEFRRVVHDFRGPLINIEGFADQISSALKILTELISSDQNSEAMALGPKISKLIEEELTPCEEFLGKSVAQLHTRIDEFSSIGK